MADSFAAEYVRELYSEAELLGRMAEQAHQCMIRGDIAEARETLANLRRRYGDMFSLRMRIDDAVRALSEEP